MEFNNNKLKPLSIRSRSIDDIKKILNRCDYKQLSSIDKDSIDDLLRNFKKSEYEGRQIIYNNSKDIKNSNASINSNQS